MNGTTNHITNDEKATCPTCGARITRAEYERIMRITDAREKQLAEELATLAREKEDIDQRRTEIESAAAAAADAKLEAQARRVEREIARVQKESATAQARAERNHKGEVERARRTLERTQARVANTEAKAKAAIARANTRAAAAAAARVQNEKQARAREVTALRAEVRRVEQRRRREGDGMRKTIAVLERKADDGNRVHFGAEAEESVVDALRDAFPSDQVERHGRDGDVVHHVVDAGKAIGTLVVEVKNTKTFNANYVHQVERAVRAHNAQYGLLASRAMPGRHEGVCTINDVIVVAPELVAEVTRVIRAAMITIARLSASEIDKTAKATAVLEYVRSEGFATAMKRVAIALAGARKSLGREKSYHDRWWRGREQAYASILREVSSVDARVRELLNPPMTVASESAAQSEAQ